MSKFALLDICTKHRLIPISPNCLDNNTSGKVADAILRRLEPQMRHLELMRELMHAVCARS